MLAVQSSLTVATQVSVDEPVPIAHTPVAHWGEEEQGEVNDNPVHIEVAVEHIVETHYDGPLHAKPFVAKQIIAPVELRLHILEPH